MHPIQASFMRLVLALTMSIVLCSLGACMRNVEDRSYRYPYFDPYLATTTIAIMKGRDERWGDNTIQGLQIDLLPGRNAVPLLEGKGKLRFRLYQSRGTAPLVIIVPGLGGSAYEGSASFIAESLVESGFHVMVMPDPFNWNFALAASSSGFPGY